MSGLVLTIEDRDPVQGPTMNDIAAAVDALRPEGGPGFLILEGSTEDYAQAAGGRGQLTVEWREYANGGFTHWVAGFDGEGAGESIDIQTNGCFVTVRKNEVLASEDAKAILGAFASGSGRPAEYLWRDMTAEL